MGYLMIYKYYQFADLSAKDAFLTEQGYPKTSVNSLTGETADSTVQKTTIPSVAQLGTDSKYYLREREETIIGSHIKSDHRTSITNGAFASEPKTAISCWGDSMIGQGGASYLPVYLSSFQYAGEHKGIGGESSSSTRTRFEAANDQKHKIQVIWTGRNNSFQVAQVLSDIAAMVDSLTHDNYVVVSVLNGDGEGIGTSVYSDITSINASLAATYTGKNYYDARAALIADGGTGTGQDLTDTNNDIPPTSLRSDALHLNSDGIAITNLGILDKLEF